MAARKQENQKSALRGWLTDILVVVIVAAVILVFIRPTIISGDSMLPKFFDGDYVIVYKMAYHSKMPKKGDVVVFETEEEVAGAEEGEKLFIKRVIGLPGDVIDIHDGQVYINGEKDDQGYTRDGVTDEPDGDLKAHKVPEGTIFCLGDNRLNSMDSRYAGVGDVSMERVTGKVVMRIYPFGRFGTLRNPYER